MISTSTVVLILLVAQTTAIVLLMQYSRSEQHLQGVEPYRTTVAVFLAEAFKLPLCIAMCKFSQGLSPRDLLRGDLLMQPDTLRCSVPALAYTVQNNLLFIALSRLAAPVFQVTYNGKTIFTALFSWFFLQRQISASQWIAVVMLFLAAVLMAGHKQTGPSELIGSDANQTAVGLSAVLVAAVLSGGSAIYLEAMLKKPVAGGKPAPLQPLPYQRVRAPATDPSHIPSPIAGLWLRNIQLGLFALPLAAITMRMSDGPFIDKHGLLHGFGAVEWAVVFVNGAGGLLIAAVMKYADSIAKCFANALAIISGTILSVPIFGFTLSMTFVCGALLAIIASVLYAVAPSLVQLRGYMLWLVPGRKQVEEVDDVGEHTDRGERETLVPRYNKVGGGARDET